MVSTGVTVLGLGLVLANSLTGSTFKDIASMLQGHGSTTTGHHAIVALAAQVLFILVLAFLAESSADAGTVIVALLLGLWLVWGMKNSDKITAASKMLGI